MLAVGRAKIANGLITVPVCSYVGGVILLRTAGIHNS